MEGVLNVFTDLKETEEKRKGIAKLEKYTITEYKARMQNIFSYGHNGFMRIEAGEFVVLSIDGYGVMMSDTPMEKKTNKNFIQNANGRVMIAGLGIGLILHNLREKVKSGEVVEIVVYEKYQDVIDLISPYYKDLPLKIIKKDILTYKPEKNEYYDTIYFDIWESISVDNLEQMSFLHRRWCKRLNKTNDKKFMDSWMKGYLKKEKRKY